MQDLSGFNVPGGFRGGGAIKVQLWWAVQATLFRWSPQVMYRWRAFFIANVWCKNRKKRSYSTFSKNYLSVEINPGRLFLGG
ncbi:putative acyl transferase WcaF [Citrobacter braakii]|nr:putative acyl transferase WcaF [Citrobacter braakii]